FHVDTVVDGTHPVVRMREGNLTARTAFEYRSLSGAESCDFRQGRARHCPGRQNSSGHGRTPGQKGCSRRAVTPAPRLLSDHADYRHVVADAALAICPVVVHTDPPGSALRLLGALLSDESDTSSANQHA